MPGGRSCWQAPRWPSTPRWVRRGLTVKGVVHAFTTGDFANWHPLVELSHMLDTSLYGLDPAGHHATNVLLHLANTLVLFGALTSMTSAVWRSAVVAALFALHPLHVEPVAWVSARKDVLSTLFGFLSMWAYVGYRRRGGSLRYLSTALLLALGLMAKPMLVCKRAGSGPDGPITLTGSLAPGPCCTVGQPTTVVAAGIAFTGAAPGDDHRVQPVQQHPRDHMHPQHRPVHPVS
jgi:hypothetical protein